MEAIEKAKELLLKGNHSFVMVNGDDVKTSDLRGIKPMFDAVTAFSDIACCSAVADKVIGKAAALLAVYGGVKTIFAGLTTHSAVDVCNRYKIQISYNMIVDAIQNREKTGLCPMEQLARDTEDPGEIKKRVEKFLNERIIS